MIGYPLKGLLGTVLIHGATELSVNGTYGGFTLPIRDGKLLMARRDDKPSIPYPGWFNCLGGGATGTECSLDQVIGREFTEESMCSVGEIVGRVGRPLRAILGRPKQPGDPVSIDTAEAWLVKFSGEPKLTDESREFRWFDFDELRKEQRIVGRDVQPFGRTMMFALWGVSLAQEPLYRGVLNSSIIERLETPRLVPSPNFQLVSNDRYLVRVTRSGSELLAEIWHNLSLSDEADENGILPGNVF